MHLRLLLLAALAAAGPALAAPPSQAPAKPATQAEAQGAEEEDHSKPPPGSPADQELWLAGRQVGTNIRGSRAEASRLARFARHNRLDERLKAAAKARPADAASLEELRGRLMDRWRGSYAIMSRTWPVDVVRGCHAQLLLFESALHAQAAKGPRPGVEPAREDVKTCVAKSGTAIKRMVDANTAFSGAIDEVVKRLAEVEPPKPAPPPRPAAPSRPAAPAGTATPAPEAPKG